MLICYNYIKIMKQNIYKKGFALPTILIASIVMLAVMAVAISTVTAVRSSINDQYYNRLAKEAAESGVAMADYCLKSSNYMVQWSGKELHPNTTCSGGNACTNADSCFVFKQTGNTGGSNPNDGTSFRTTFSVGEASTNNYNRTVKSTGKVELIRKSNSAVWKTYTYVINASIGANSNTLSQGYNLQRGCAIDNTSWVKCWGNNTSGAVGNNSTTNVSSPVSISRGTIPTSQKIRYVASGYSTTCVIVTNNDAYCWGMNGGYDGNGSQIGDGTQTERHTPVKVSQGNMVSSDGGFQDIAPARYSTCGLTTSKWVYCWGYGGSGRLGTGNSTSATTPVRVVRGEVPSGSMSKALFSGTSHHCMIAENDWIYCWGYNAYGLLGDNTTTARSVPTEMSRGQIPSGVGIVTMSTSDTSSCAVGTNGRAYCWGMNDRGQIGDGSSGTADRYTPRLVSYGDMSSSEKIIDIGVGSKYACAVTNVGKTYCWGAGNNGRLGNDSLDDYSTPKQISNGDIPSGVRARSVALGTSVMCMEATNNKVYCWGYGGNGTIGDGTTNSRSVPTEVSGLTTANPAKTTWF